MEHQEEQLRQQQPELELASVLYKPCLQDQQVDNSGRESDAMSIDQCQTIREMDDSQLLGAATATNTGKADEASREGGCLVDVEVKHEVKAEAKVMETNTGKRRRGRPPRSHVKPVPGPAPPPRKKKDEEDVCFICFDGGSLVLCDRRGCPKAYHPACIKRDESFFRSKAKWNCGWHICSNCQKASHYLCYTCTYSVCKGCVKDADYLVVRGNKGFCGTCMRTVMLIENAAQGDKEMVQVDFDDKSSWEYLFKVYWLYLKGKLSLTLDELTRAKNPWKGAGTAAPKLESLGHLYDHNDDRGSRSNNSYGNLIANHAKKRKTKIQPMFLHKVESLNMENSGSYKLMPLLEDTKWATKELLEFVAHMRNGDTSMLSQYDVQFLLLEYVKRNSLRDPHQKCQIVCDSRLTNLFGKERVGHFEMLKLLESHFLIQENFSAANTIKRGVLEAVSCQVEADRNNDFQMMGNDKKRKTRKKFEERGSVTNPDDYAAIDVHNINLIYLSRNLMENLIDDTITFHDKVVGSIVRIRISGSDQKQDMYRLVQVVGTSKAAEPYSVGSRTIDIMLEILNLDKKEVISIDGISNQEFSEDECRRLRQSIKCGLIKRLTVGEIREKAMALQAVRVNDGLEAEILRLNHLRDRASEKGHRKELREYVEKLELLNSPEERRHRLREIPEVHGDPNMDPSYESEEDGVLDLNKRDNHVKGRCSGFCKNEKEAVSSRRGGDILKDTGNRAQKNTFAAAECSNGLNAPRIQVGPTDSGWNNQAVVRSEPSGTVSEGLAQSHFAGMEHPVDDTEVDKIWHYQDPTGKVQGPFSMFQLRKWSTSGHFPPELRIWRINEKQDGSILLTDALNGQYHKDKLLLHDGYLSQQEVKVPSNDQDINNLESRWSGSVNAAQVDSKMLEVRRNSMRDDATANSIGNNDFVRNSTANDTSANSSTCTLTADVGNSNERQTGSFVSGWNSLKSNHSLPDQPQVNSSLSSPLVSGNPCGILSHEVRKDPAGERWNTGQSHATEDSPNNAEHRTNIEHSYEKQGDSEGNSSQSCGQNWKAPTVNSSSNVWDLNCSFVCLAKSLETSKQNQDINFPDLPSPTPKSSREDLGGQAVEMKQSVSSSVVVQDSGISWSTASSLVGGARVREVAGEWSGYSPTPSKPSVEEWDATAAPAPSAKPVEMAGELATTPTSGCAQVTHSSPSHPPSNASDWPAIVAEPNECDESVSDLLAEVEAMESLNGLPSPTSILHCGGALPQGSENDCFSPVEELSPACDLGKSDALSSTNDFQMPSQSTITGEQLVLSHAAILDPQKVSGGSSSTNAEVEEDTKPSDVSTDQCEAGSDIPPPGPPVTSWEVASTASAWRVGSETTGASWGAVQGNANLGWGGLAQANSTLGWGAGQGTAENASMSSGIPAGNPGVWGSQPRYAGDRFPGPRDRDFQGRDSSFGRGRSFWNNRQSSFGGAHGVGSSRPLHKGQRVCKFHESGHCKKGASCSFWHP